MGIIVAHGTLGAVWVQQETAEAHAPIPTCINSPGALPYFHPPLEILAMRLEPIDADVAQP
jgi:hypothetical protein